MMKIEVKLRFWMAYLFMLEADECTDIAETVRLRRTSNRAFQDALNLGGTHEQYQKAVKQLGS